VVPPPPEKQAVGRFESGFVESRRQALEKMLNKTAAHPTLQQDADLKLFLESEAFNVDVKHKERKEPNLGESKGMFSSLGINVGSSNKFVEQDDVSTAAILVSALATSKLTRTQVVSRSACLHGRSGEPAQGSPEGHGHNGPPAQSYG